MQNVSIKGFIYAALSSATFGLAPFFTISLLLAGFSSFEVLAYRWGIASLTLVVFGIMLGETFRISRKDWGTVFILSLLRAATSFSLVIAYQNISSGVASTIHFMYPVLTTLIMMIFFRLLLQSIRNWKPEYFLLRRFWRKKQFRRHQSIRFRDLQEHSTV